MPRRNKNHKMRLIVHMCHKRVLAYVKILNFVSHFEFYATPHGIISEQHSCQAHPIWQFFNQRNAIFLHFFVCPSPIEQLLNNQRASPLHRTIFGQSLKKILAKKCAVRGLAFCIKNYAPPYIGQFGNSHFWKNGTPPRTMFEQSKCHPHRTTFEQSFFTFFYKNAKPPRTFFGHKLQI